MSRIEEPTIETRLQSYAVVLPGKVLEIFRTRTSAEAFVRGWNDYYTKKAMNEKNCSENCLD